MELLEIKKGLGDIVRTCYNLEDVNRLVKENPKELVRISEKIVDDQIEKVVKCVIKGKYKFLLLSGPSSSGKTTTANIIIKKLQKKGKRAIRVSLDDFFIDLDKCPVQKDGTVDKETITKIDLPCFNKFFKEIMQHNRAYKPVFNFVEDKRRNEPELIEVGEDDLILVEGTHALNPQLVEVGEYANRVLKVYACVNSVFRIGKNVVINSRKIRLIRRLIRDLQTRGESAEKTVKYWDMVCKGEDKYVAPYKQFADFMIDTTHIYELAVYDKFVPGILTPIKDLEYADELLKVFKKAGSLSKSYVPSSSLLWEFLVKKED